MWPAAWAILALAVLSGSLTVRARLDDWVLQALERRVAERFGGRLHVDRFDAGLWPPTVEFDGLSLGFAAANDRLTVASGSARLSWLGLTGLAAGRIHLAELVLSEPVLELDGPFPRGRPDGSRPARLDLRIDRFELDSGGVRFEDQTRPLDIRARDLELHAGWRPAAGAIVGSGGLHAEIRSPPLVEPLPLTVRTGFRWRGQLVELFGLRAAGAGLELTGELDANWHRTPRILGRGDVSAKLRQLAPLLDPAFPPIAGELSGPFTFRAGPEPLEIEGRLRAGGGRFGRLEARAVAAAVRFVPGRLELAELSAAAYDGHVDGGVEIVWGERRAFEARIEGHDLGSTALFELAELPLPIASRVEMDLELRGEIGRPASWEAQGAAVASPDLAAAGGVPAEARGEFSMNGGRLELHVPQARLASAAVALTLDVEPRAIPRRGRLRLEGLTDDARETQLGALRILDALGLAFPAALREPLRGRGPVEATVRFGGDPGIDLGLQLERGAWGPQEFDRGEVDLDYRADRLSIRRLELLHDEQRLSASTDLRLRPVSVGALELSAWGFDPAPLWALAGVGGMPDGRLTAELSIEDGAGTRSGGGAVRFSEMRWLGEPLGELEAELELRSDALHLPRLSLSGPAIEAVATADWDPATGDGRLRLDEGRVRLEALDAVHALALPLSVECELELGGALKLIDGRPQGVLELSGPSWRVEGKELGRVAGELELHSTGLRAHLASGERSGWDLHGALDWVDEFPVELALALRETPFDFEQSAYGLEWARATGSFELSGSLRGGRPLRVSGELEHAELRSAGGTVELASPIRLSLEDGRFTAEPIRLVGPSTAVEASWTHDLERGRVQADADGSFDLGLLAAPFPELRAAGPVEIEIAARGPIDSPTLSGSLRAEGGRLLWLGFPQPLDQLGFHITFDGNGAELHELSSRFGNGAVSAAGRATFRGFGLESYEIDASAARARVAYPDGFRGTYEGTLQLRGTTESATLGGRLQMLRGVYDKQLTMFQLFGAGARPPTEDASTLPQHLALDVEIVSDGNAWVRNRLAKVESRFDVHVGGSARRPQLTGRLWMLPGGQLVFRDVRYRVTSGSLDFVELDRLNPYLVLRAETSVQGYTVFLTVEGTVDRFEYTLTSEPTLETRDIIALLTTGSTLEEISSAGGGGDAEFTGDLAANYFAGALTDPFEKRLQQLLKFELVRINPPLAQSEADPTTRITLGKEVAEDVFVTFSSNVSDNEEQVYEVEWQASPRFHFIGGRNTLGGIGGDVRYTDRFWWKKPGYRAEAARPPKKETGGSPSDAQRVSSITIEGAKRKDRQRIRKRLRLGRGDRFSRSAMFRGLEAIRSYYVDAGRIEATVDASAAPRTDGGVDVVYRVAPGPETTLSFAGVAEKQEKRLRSALEKFWVESVFSEELYDDTAEKIRDFYHERGHYTVDLGYDSRLDDGHRRVLYTVDSGSPVRVVNVKIEGNVELADEELRRQMLTRASSILSRKLLVPEVLEEDIRGIRSLYRNAGFLEARVGAPQIRLSTSADRAEVTLMIDEGPRFTIAGLGLPEGLVVSPDELRDWTGLEFGQVFSPVGLLQAESRLRRQLDERGYPDARVRGRFEVSDREVDVEFDVELGGLKRVGEIHIEGNNLTRRKIIRRELALGVGDLISREKLLQSQHRLYRLGIFRNVRVTYVPLEGEDDSLQRLDVVVDEAPPFTTSIGAGYDSEAGARIGSSLGHENVGGYDRVLGLQTRFSDIEKRVRVIGEEPRLFARKLPALINVSWEELERVGFTEKRRSTAIRIEKRFNKKWNSYLRYGFQRVELEDVVNPEEVQEEKLEDARLGDIGFAAIRDTRDDPFLATRGTSLTIGTRLFLKPLLSETAFVKTIVSGSWFHKIRGGGSVLASSLRVGAAIPFREDEAVPISEGFFAGGDSTLRGFPRDEVGPPTGGEALFLINQELRFPLRRGLKGLVFYDAGNVYEEAGDLDPFDLRHVLGIGLRLEMPMGPLRLEYGRKLDRENGESSGELFLAIGAAF